jgi:hypothetical protein
MINCVTPAKAGVHLQHNNFHAQVIDPRLRGNDERGKWIGRSTYPLYIPSIRAL